MKKHKRWSFQLFLIIFIFWSTKFTNIKIHGDFGLTLIFFLIIFLTLSIGKVKGLLIDFFQNLNKNQLFVFLLFTYSFMVLVKFFLGQIIDYQCVFNVIVLFLALFYSLTYLYESKCLRYFQIFFIIISGIQSFFTFFILANDFSIARIAVDQTINAGKEWEFGEQGIFAIYAIIAPTILMRSFSEKGLLKFILLFFCFFIICSSAISQFSTALGIIIMAPLIFFLFLFFLSKNNHKIRILFYLFILLIFFYCIIQIESENIFFKNSLDKIFNAWIDPSSGGYGEKYESESRWYLAIRSINSFITSPIFGNGIGSIRFSKAIGGHSSLFDLLGFYGLIGGGAFIGMVYLSLKICWNRARIQRDLYSIANLTTLILFIFAGIVNPYWEGQPYAIIMLLIVPFNFKI